jgi:hypothetical protein
MIPDERPNLHPITTTFQPNPAKNEFCWFHLSPHNNNRKQIQHVDPVDQLKYLGREDCKEGLCQMWFCYSNFADGIFVARLLNCKTLCRRGKQD